MVTPSVLPDSLLYQLLPATPSQTLVYPESLKTVSPEIYASLQSAGAGEPEKYTVASKSAIELHANVDPLQPSRSMSL
jgi:hypothetical protein